MTETEKCIFCFLNRAPLDSERKGFIFMKKIGIITCIRSNDVCTRAGCLKAFHNRTATFSDYDTETELAVLMTCNGCAEYNPLKPEEDPGMQEKLERLKKEEIEVMHAGACRLHKGVECARMTEICDLIEKMGIRVVRGTHKE